MKGIVADIQRASVHDGPGMRTTIFFKGCPLNCAWCHNPECIAFEPQVLCYPDKCIGCGKCDEGCYAGARVPCGRSYTPQEILEAVLEDQDYYGAEGGVTFSGGEPLAQKEFLKECLTLCKNSGIHCAIETSLLFYEEDIFRLCDLVMADLKIWDDGLHKQYTGVSNKTIKEHFAKLNTLNIPMIARTPVIPEIEQGIDKISAFFQPMNNVVQYELLPYHPLGESKRKALGLKEQTFQTPNREFMKGIERYAYLSR